MFYDKMHRIYNLNFKCVAPVAISLTLDHFSSLQTLAHYKSTNTKYYKHRQQIVDMTQLSALVL
jgi:hypothetical protein